MIGRNGWWRGVFICSLLGTAALGLWLGSRPGPAAEEQAVLPPRAESPEAGVGSGAVTELSEILGPLQPEKRESGRLPLDLPYPSACRVMQSHSSGSGSLREDSAVLDWPGIQAEEAVAHFSQHIEKAGFALRVSPQRSATVVRHYVRSDQVFSLSARPTGQGVRLTLIFRYTVPSSHAILFSEDVLT